MTTVTTVAPARRRYRASAPIILSLFVSLCALFPLARAQLLADVMMTTAIMAQFDQSVSLPRGTMRAVGAGVNALVARIPGSGSWTDWEAYALGGVVTGLAGAKANEVATAYALAGYFEQSRSETTVTGPSGPEAHTRIVYVSDDGTSRLLYLIKAGQEVVWLTARAR